MSKKESPKSQEKTVKKVVKKAAKANKPNTPLTEQQRTTIAKAKFLQLLAKKTSVTSCCLAMGIGRTTYYEWLDDPDFDEAVKQINDALIDELEDITMQIARDKDAKPFERLQAVGIIAKARGKHRGHGTSNINLDADVKVRQYAVVKLPDNGRRTYSPESAKPANKIIQAE